VVRNAQAHENPHASLYRRCAPFPGTRDSLCCYVRNRLPSSPPHQQNPMCAYRPRNRVDSAVALTIVNGSPPSIPPPHLSASNRCLRPALFCCRRTRCDSCYLLPTSRPGHRVSPGRNSSRQSQKVDNKQNKHTNKKNISKTPPASPNEAGPPPITHNRPHRASVDAAPRRFPSLARARARGCAEPCCDVPVMPRQPTAAATTWVSSSPVRKGCSLALQGACRGGALDRDTTRRPPHTPPHTARSVGG